MKQIFTLLFSFLFGSGLYAQHSSSERYLSQKYSSHNKKEINFNGQWKGGFDENSIPGLNDDNTRYVLELTTKGSVVSGYSYTYFDVGGNKYYTICRLSGTLNRETNDLVVTEVERIKFNTPPDFGNCFQTHRLHYEKDTGNIEILKGVWLPAPNQGQGCGTGTTVLSRRIVSNLPIGFMPHKKNNTASSAPAKKPEHKKSVAEIHKKPEHEIAKQTPHKPKIAAIEKAGPIQNMDAGNENTESKISNENSLTPTLKGYETRKKEVVKTIAIIQPTFHLDFYDNGAIDGDSITVFYNGKIVLSHRRLSDKPISLDLTLDKNAKENIVTMYADNLGTIPPNTALMIVTDGGKRYEVRMESDYGKSGSVIFVPEK
ncbi:MAG: hypothetical protein ABI261_00435 [Ginsengibacter sp.]